jgi:hypothetical protein
LAATTLKDADNSDADVGTKKLSAPNMPIVQGNFLVVGPNLKLHCRLQCLPNSNDSNKEAN